MEKQSNPDEVICPACVHQFRAIPENVQAELRRLHAENERLKRQVPAADLLGAVARGWTHEKNASKAMDPDLAISIAAEVSALLEDARRNI